MWNGLKAEARWKAFDVDVGETADCVRFGEAPRELDFMRGCFADEPAV